MWAYERQKMQHNKFYNYVLKNNNPYIVIEENGIFTITNVKKACAKWCANRGLDKCTHSLGSNIIQYVKQNKITRLDPKKYRFQLEAKEIGPVSKDEQW